MHLKLVFHYKNGVIEMTEDENWEGPIPRIKEEILVDEKHRGMVFSVIHLISKKEVIIKIR